MSQNKYVYIHVWKLSSGHGNYDTSKEESKVMTKWIIALGIRVLLPLSDNQHTLFDHDFHNPYHVFIIVTIATKVLWNKVIILSQTQILHKTTSGCFVPKPQQRAV